MKYILNIYEFYLKIIEIKFEILNNLVKTNFSDALAIDLLLVRRLEIVIVTLKVV